MTRVVSDSGIEAVARFVTERTGLSFPPHRSRDVEAGVRRAMQKARASDAERYLARLRAGRESLDDLAAELTVGETYFFREPGQLAFLYRHALPETLQRRGAEHVVRIWSAGCASGEEAYSLAMLAEEAGIGEKVAILGTDISPVALGRARQGRYRAWSMRGADPVLVDRYFRRTDEGWEIEDRIKARVSFELYNLLEGTYPSLAVGASPMDVILCRNVLIYFEREAIRQVARSLFALLAEGGYVLTGASDPPLHEEAPFERIVAPAGVVYRRSAESAAVQMRRAAPMAVASERMREDAREATAVAEAKAATGASISEPAAEEETDRPRDRVAARAGAFVPNRAEDAATVVARLRALANREGAESALPAVARESLRYPLSAEIHFLQALLLLDLRRDREAARVLKRILYIDRSLAVAHFLLGSALRRQGDVTGARRAYARARDLARARPADEPLALTDGEPAGRLVRAASDEIAMLSGNEREAS